MVLTRVAQAMVDESDTKNVPAYMAAVKLLKGEPSGEQRAEFLREAVVMAQFNHFAPSMISSLTAWRVFV